MKGKHHIMVENDHVRYEFDIKRNITVIQGDSATGKTSLLDLLRQYSMRKEGSGVLLQSDKKCVVYGGTIDNWKPVIEAEHDSIIFIDEDYPFVFSKDFAATIKNEYSGAAEPPFRKIGNRESGAGNRHTAIVTFASLLA